MVDVNWLEEPEGLPSLWGAFLRAEAGAVFPPSSPGQAHPKGRFREVGWED